MTIFENFKTKSFDELAEWLDEYGGLEDSPWMRWWDDNYCGKCKPEMVPTECDDGYGGKYECEYEHSWCELNDNCKFFQNMNKLPDTIDIVKMWLGTESNN